MKRLSSLFLVCFLLAGGLSLSAELAHLAGSPHLLDVPRKVAVGAALLTGLVIYFGLSINRNFRKLTLVPALLSLLWGLFDFFPLESLLGSDYRLYAAAGQLLLGTLLLSSSRRVAAQVGGTGFSARHLLRFCLLNILLLPLLLFSFAYAGLSSLIETQTAGFVRLKPNGLYMVEKIYRKDAQTVRLTAMIHVGQQGYYDELASSFAQGNSLLLAEGVSDHKGLLKSGFSYAQLADLLGLRAQEKLQFARRMITPAQLDQGVPDRSGRLDILRADIDLQEFDPRTIAVLNAIGRDLLSNRSLRSGYQKFSAWAEQHITRETNRVVLHDLIQKRNRQLLSYLSEGLRHYRTIIIPWGALHLPGIEADVKSRGFLLVKKQERLSIDFFQLPYAQLWQALMGRQEERNTTVGVTSTSPAPR